MNRSTIRYGWVQRHWMVAAVLVTLWLIPMPALAQSDTSAAPSSAQSAAPKPVTGVAFDSPFALEEVGHVLIRGSVRAGETFDDNIAGGGVSDWYTSIVPALSLQLTRRHSVVHANYAPSFLIYSRFDQFNTVSHQFDVDFSHRFSPRWTFSGGQRLSYLPETAGLFQGNSGFRNLDGTLLPAPTGSYPRAATTQGQSFAEVQYQWSKRSYVDVSGTYTLTNFSQHALVGFHGAGARIGYNYRYNARWTGAVNYQFQRSWFGQGFGRMENHAWLLGGSYRRKRWDLSVSAGPSVTSLEGNQVVT